VGDKLSFELDQTQLPAPKEVIAKTKFTWNFGDGGKGSGLKQDHTYLKMGSYILTIYADDGSTPTPQLLQSVLINILPNKEYQLPKSVIKVNGKKSSDPLTDIIQINMANPVMLSGEDSETKSSKIKSVRWDLGDKKDAKTIEVTHKYPEDLSQVFPVLRVVDENGFISDSFLEIQNSKQEQVASKGGETPVENSTKKYLIYGGLVVIGVLVSLFIRKKVIK
jgi:hypothetical protein